MKNYTFLRWGGEGPLGFKGAPIHKFLSQLLLVFGKHMKMLCFKFHQNCTLNEEFDFFEGGKEETPGGKEAPLHKFLS